MPLIESTHGTHLKRVISKTFPKKKKKKSKWQVETNWETFGVLVCKLCSLRLLKNRIVNPTASVTSGPRGGQTSCCRIIVCLVLGNSSLWLMTAFWGFFCLMLHNEGGTRHIPPRRAYIMNTDLNITGMLNTMLELERNSIFGAASDCWDFIFNNIESL